MRIRAIIAALFVAGQVAALDQGDCMRKIRERHAAGEPRAMCALGGVGGRHELACSTAPQPPASAELLRLRQDTETSRPQVRCSCRESEFGFVGVDSC